MNYKEMLNNIAIVAQKYYSKDEKMYEALRHKATALINHWEHTDVNFRNKTYGVQIHNAVVKTIRDKRIFISVIVTFTKENEVALEKQEYGILITPGWFCTNNVKILGADETAEGLKVRNVLKQAFLQWYESKNLS